MENRGYLCHLNHNFLPTPSLRSAKWKWTLSRNAHRWDSHYLSLVEWGYSFKLQQTSFIPGSSMLQKLYSTQTWQRGLVLPCIVNSLSQHERLKILCHNRPHPRLFTEHSLHLERGKPRGSGATISTQCSIHGVSLSLQEQWVAFLTPSSLAVFCTHSAQRKIQAISKSFTGLYKWISFIWNKNWGSPYQRPLLMLNRIEQE